MALTKPVMAGNWKMHHDPGEAERFLADFVERVPARNDRTVALFPPAISLVSAREALRDRPDILLGIQNIHWEERGAFTGESSASMAASAGARLVLVGHSERRHIFGESPEEAGRKVRAALSAGMMPVLCVGETLEQRDAGDAERVVLDQLDAGLAGVSPDDAARVLIAYEPVWAIGTGRTAAPQDAAEMHGRIRAYLRERFGAAVANDLPILYGGSVKPDNVDDLLAAAEVDGVLVGGASLDPESFGRICQAAA